MMNNCDKLLTTMFDEGAISESTALAMSYLADRSTVGKNILVDSIELESKGFVISVNKEDVFTGKVSKHLCLTDTGITRVNTHKSQPQPQPQPHANMYCACEKNTINIVARDVNRDSLIQHTLDKVKETDKPLEIYKLVYLGEVRPIRSSEWVVVC